MAHKLEELPLFPKMIAFCDAVDAILERPTWRRNRDLHDQIADANDSVTSNMYEGWEQPSDAAFAVYVYRSKASVAEVIGRLKRGLRRRLVSPEEIAVVEPMGEELGRMFGGFVKYLEASGFKDRGRYRPRAGTKNAGIKNARIEDSGIEDSRIRDSED